MKGGEHGMNQGRSTSTRNEILNMLKLQRSLTVSVMAENLEITEMAVRRHLNTLERDNLIQAKMVRQAMGRPTNVYSLTEEAESLFPRNYSDFALDLLQDIKEIGGEGQVDSLFRLREERMTDMYKQHVHGETMEKKVNQLANLQNQRGYMVEIEKNETTGEFIFKEYNCPISQVAKEFNQACECELSLFKRVLDTEVVQSECIAQGEDKCMYVIKPNDESK